MTFLRRLDENPPPPLRASPSRGTSLFKQTPRCTVIPVVINRDVPAPARPRMQRPEPSRTRVSRCLVCRGSASATESTAAVMISGVCMHVVAVVGALRASLEACSAPRRRPLADLHSKPQSYPVRRPRPARSPAREQLYRGCRWQGQAW